MRAATILWAILAAAAGTSLFMLKYEVQSQEQRLSGLRKDIVETQENIHVLKAEWSYLNDPSRLREQAEHHLGLHPLKPSQIVTIASLPMNDQPPAETPPAEAPLAQGQPEAQLAPMAPIPPAPVVTRKAPAPTVRAMPTVPVPAPMPAKPARSMTAVKAPPAPAAKLAAAKPAVKPAAKTAKVAAKTRPAPATYSASAYPVYTSAPAKPAGGETTSNAGNVMVIKSPALAEPEVASTRVRP